ncbi:MAG: adenylate/guanylate cyclase domain-containing protein [Cyanobacteriota bacterium]|nr:adenylate/guanylate cyclase domain-containing protein [Cyanobacteriota bacterium]
MKKPVIICIDDEQAVLESLKVELKRALGDKYLIETAEGGEDALELFSELLEDEYEVALVLSDYIMPDIKGDELLKRFHQLSPKTLKIMLTGQADLEAVGNAIRYAKLYRYLPKPWQPEDLKLTVVEAIHSYLQDQKLDEQNARLLEMNQDLEIANRKQASLIESLIEKEEQYRSIFENALEGIFQITPKGSYLSANTALAEIYGYNSPNELIQALANIGTQLYVDGDRYQELTSLMAKHGQVSKFESQVYRKDGSVIWISEDARCVCDANGAFLYYQGFVQDITERKEAEAERERFTNKLYQLNQDLEKALDSELELSLAAARFVPHQFLSFLGYESLVDVRLGDSVQYEMSTLFADIRNFTTLSETMTPEDNFKFINAYLCRMEPAIIEHGGFIDKYIGDAIMALFGGGADDAVKASISMLNRLNEYNKTRQRPERPQLKIGIGINTGDLILGTVGGESRMDGTVISDAVNLAARLEELTKNYGVSLLISHYTFEKLENPNDYAFRFIDRVKVKGKSNFVTVFEIFDADPPEIVEGKLLTKAKFEEAMFFFSQRNCEEAAKLFQDCLTKNPQDPAAKIYLKRCQKLINN